MVRKIPCFCVSLLLILTSASAARRRLNSISELRDCDLSEHTNIVELLHWFATKVDIDGNVIRLTFDPYTDYGSHYYRNAERLFDSLPQGYSYYTVGNVHKATSVRLPSYVVYSPTPHDGWNKARIVFRVRERNAGSQPLIDQIYITQHYGSSDNQGTRYNPDYTYEVTTNLLLQIRRYTINEIRRRPDSSRIGPFENTSDGQSQQIPSSRQHDYKPVYDTTTSNNDCMSGICVAVIVLVFFVCIWFYLSTGRK